VQVIHPCCNVDRVGQAGKIFCDGHDEGIEWAAGSFLPELAGCEPEDVASDRDAAHVLVAASHAGFGVAAYHEAVDPSNLAGAVENRPAARPKLAAAPGEY
jgi:hypothetical protein